MRYDTSDLCRFDLDPEAGKRCQRTFEPPATVRFIKLLVENLDPAEPVADLTLTATLGD